MSGALHHTVTGPVATPASYRDVYSGRLLLCAGGRSLWPDVAELGGIRGVWEAVRDGDLAGVMVVNVLAFTMPLRVEHIVSIHAEAMANFVNWRNRTHKDERRMTHSMFDGEAVEHVWKFDMQAGCSGLFAALVGCAVGYDEIWLAGCPEDKNGHFYDPPAETYAYTHYGGLQQWEYARDALFGGRVKSLSGNTARVLGRPAALGEAA